MLSRRFFLSPNSSLILISTWPECRLVRCVPVLDFLHCYCDFVCSTLVKCFLYLLRDADLCNCCNICMEMVFLKYEDDGNARSTQVKHRQQNALNHKVQNLFYTGSERNSRNQQICLPTLYLRVVFSFK